MAETTCHACEARANRVFSEEDCLRAELVLERDMVMALVAQRDRVMLALEAAGVHRDLVLAIAMDLTGLGDL